MPRKRRSQWREPIILVPIIAAVITAIIGPIVVLIAQNPLMIQNVLKYLLPGPGPSPGSDGSGLSVRTDKGTYGVGDLVHVSGTLDEPVQGKTIRLDVYDPEGKVFQPYNESFDAAGVPDKLTPVYPRLSDIQVKPNDKGLFSYRFPLAEPSADSFIKGNYTIAATSEGMTRNTTFAVR